MGQVHLECVCIILIMNELLLRRSIIISILFGVFHQKAREKTMPDSEEKYNEEYEIEVVVHNGNESFEPVERRSSTWYVRRSFKVIKKGLLYILCGGLFVTAFRSIKGLFVGHLQEQLHDHSKLLLSVGEDIGA